MEEKNVVDGIQTAGLWCQKPSLDQLRHHHCRLKLIFVSQKYGKSSSSSHPPGLLLEADHFNTSECIFHHPGLTSVPLKRHSCILSPLWLDVETKVQKLAAERLIFQIPLASSLQIYWMASILTFDFELGSLISKEKLKLFDCVWKNAPSISTLQVAVFANDVQTFLG